MGREMEEESELQWGGSVCAAPQIVKGLIDYRNHFLFHFGMGYNNQNIQYQQPHPLHSVGDSSLNCYTKNCYMKGKETYMLSGEHFGRRAMRS